MRRILHGAFILNFGWHLEVARSQASSARRSIESALDWAGIIDIKSLNV